MPAARNTIPRITPTVVIEVALRRNTTQAMISHAIPLTRYTHQ
jgi:hypothetical protein